MEVYTKQTGTINFYKERSKEIYAVLKYNYSNNSIKFSCPEKKKEIVFEAKDSLETKTFWNKLIESSDSELTKLNEILDEMKNIFQSG